MKVGCIAYKLGMSRLWLENKRKTVAVTLLYVPQNRITQVKSRQKEGYDALQVASCAVDSAYRAVQPRAARRTKPERNHYVKSEADGVVDVQEFRIADTDLQAGSILSMDQFRAGDKVNIRGISKGKGFAGGIKRWGFSAQRASHGNSISHRALGSAGQCQLPGRVWKGKRMAGHAGARRVCIQSLEILCVDMEQQMIVVRGAVPGASGGCVVVRFPH